jgi:CRISPR-associated endonuclease Cas2
MSYLIVYDIKKLDHAIRLKVNRRLQKLGASKLQHSVWELSDFSELNDLMLLITSAGGKALVLEKKIAAE